MQVTDETQILFHALVTSDADLLQACIYRLQRPLQVSLHWVFLGDKQAQEPAFRLLCGHGCDVDELNPSGETPLIRAIAHGYNNVVACLLELGANVELSNNKLETPLFHAALRSNVYALYSLVEKDADPNIASSLGVTPLMCIFIAEENARFAVVLIWMARLLRARGACTHLLNAEGDNAISYYFRNCRHHLDVDSTQKLDHIMLSTSTTPTN